MVGLPGVIKETVQRDFRPPVFFIIELGESLTKIENILIHWSVAQAGSNEEKTGYRKYRWTVPITNRRNYGTVYVNC